MKDRKITERSVK